MRDGSTFETIAFALAGAPIIIWLGVLIAPAIEGEGSIIFRLIEAFQHPLALTIVDDTLKAVAVLLAAYMLAILIYMASKRNWRRGTEHGSAEWGDAKAIARRYKSKDKLSDRLLSRSFRMSYDAHKHRRNLNTLVVGGSGAGKTRGYSLPNAAQANTSMVILDPKGEIVRAVGHLLEAQGFTVLVLDLVNMDKSHCYNPFNYLRDDNDVQRLSTNLFKATAPKNSTTQDPFWEIQASVLFQALVFLLKYEAPPEEQNFATLLELFRAGEVREDDDACISVLDEIFDRLEMEKPDHIAVKYYRDYRVGSAKTLKSIQSTLASHLEKFNLESLAALTATDELDLASLGEKKVVLFAVIPDNDTSFNFLVSILYTQLFQQLFELADTKYKGALPVHVHFLMDEFANVSLPDDFEKILSTMRSRNISASIILQNLAQLRALFDKQWESIVGNCDEFLYLGGNEQSTHKYVSELLGKETIDTDTHGRTMGRGGSWTTNYQKSGRELMTPDEVRMLDNGKSILFVRGERPMLDGKLDISRHARANHTTEGKAKPYEHGSTERLGACIAFGDMNATANVDMPEADFELISSNEL